MGCTRKTFVRHGNQIWSKSFSSDHGAFETHSPSSFHTCSLLACCARFRFGSYTRNILNLDSTMYLLLYSLVSGSSVSLYALVNAFAAELGFLSVGINSSVFSTLLVALFSQYYLRKWVSCSTQGLPLLIDLQVSCHLVPQIQLLVEVRVWINFLCILSLTLRTSAALDGGTEIMIFVSTFAVNGGSGTARPFPHWALVSDTTMRVGHVLIYLLRTQLPEKWTSITVKHWMIEANFYSSVVHDDIQYSIWLVICRDFYKTRYVKVDVLQHTYLITTVLRLYVHLFRHTKKTSTEPGTKPAVRSIEPSHLVRFWSNDLTSPGVLFWSQWRH